MTEQLAITKEKLSREHEAQMRDWVLSQIDDKYKDLFSNVNRPWDKCEVLSSFFNTIQIKDIVLVPEVYGRKNKIKYTSWYSILAIANMVGYRVDGLKVELLKAFDFLTIPQLEDKIQSPLFMGTESSIIIPSHLRDKNYKRRLFVSSQAILTLVRHIAFKNVPIIMSNGDDARTVARDLLDTLDTLDATINDLVDDMNKEMANYINKLNTGKLPTSNDRKLVKAMCTTAVSTSSSSGSDLLQSKEEMCKEQESMMREWIIAKMPEKLLPYFKNVTNAWDRTEVLLSCIKDLNYKDIILVPKLNNFTDELKYEPFFKLNSLASMMGYAIPANLFKQDKVLHTHTKYTLNAIKDLKIQTGHYGQSVELIIPEHLDNKTDSNRNNYIYIDLSACEDLISAAMKQTKFKEKAKEFKRCLDDIKQINDLFITIINKEMANYINKLNTGKLPTSQDKKVVDAICATSGNPSQSKEEMCKEQESMMREWIMSHLHENILPYFHNVNRPWDRTEVLLANIKRLNYNDIILNPSTNMFGDICYQPYFKLYTLASKLGYEKPGDLCCIRKPLYGHKKYYLVDLTTQVTDPSSGDQYISVIPDHLNDKTDRRRNECIYINAESCKELLSAAMRQPKFKERAGEFNKVYNTVNDISNAIISKLNQLVAEYRYQQQANTNAIMNNKLAAYQSAQEAAKKAQEEATKEIEAKQKRIEEETKLFALRVHPDVDIKKTHYGYIFSSDDYMKKDLYKIGITDNLKNRERDAHTYHPEGGFLYTIETYNAKITEYALHQILKECRLQYKINSGDEWFKIPGLDEAKKLLNLAINNTDTVYEHVMTYPSQLRDRIVNPVPVPTMLAIMPPVDKSEEEPPIKEFIQDIANMIGNGNSICKTNLIKKLRDLANSTKYKKHKTKLPTEFDTFTASTNDNGIKTETKSAGRTTTIKFTIEITTTEDEDDHN